MNTVMIFRVECAYDFGCMGFRVSGVTLFRV